MPDLSPDLQHFLDLARDGCSCGGAIAAELLANDVLDNVPILDESALRGLCEFIGRAKYAPQATRELLEEER